MNRSDDPSDDPSDERSQRAKGPAEKGENLCCGVPDWPGTPRALLEARYQAFVNGQIDFLLDSHHPERRSQVDRRSIESWANKSKWQGLSIENERTEDDKAFISFTVRYERDFQAINHRENAEFRKHDGRWFYFDSEFPKPDSIKRKGEKVGRNDPCSCGSGKKFKKCCGIQ